ncbi:hypothetical protein ACOMHN_021275 [Nucella lapillus]
MVTTPSSAHPFTPHRSWLAKVDPGLGVNTRGNHRHPPPLSCDPPPLSRSPLPSGVLIREVPAKAVIPIPPSHALPTSNHGLKGIRAKPLLAHPRSWL